MVFVIIILVFAWFITIKFSLNIYIYIYEIIFVLNYRNKCGFGPFLCELIAFRSCLSRSGYVPMFIIFLIIFSSTFENDILVFLVQAGTFYNVSILVATNHTRLSIISSAFLNSTELKNLVWLVTYKKAFDIRLDS